MPAEPLQSLETPPAPACRPLAELPAGATGVVEGVDAGSRIGRRLQDLGFVRGTEVRVIRRAPLGDPVLYELRGTQLCLRRSEARLVQVRPE